ncbi:hypothetical protein LguiA_001479 [Lonicera macranthoides]
MRVRVGEAGEERVDEVGAAEEAGSEATGVAVGEIVGDIDGSQSMINWVALDTKIEFQICKSCALLQHCHCGCCLLLPVAWLLSGAAQDKVKEAKAKRKNGEVYGSTTENDELSEFGVSQASSISLRFKSAANSEATWEQFFPSDYPEILSRSVAPLVLPLRKNSIYIHLSQSNLLLDDGKMFFIGQRKWKEVVYDRGKTDSQFWNWTCSPDSRYRSLHALGRRRGKDGWIEIEIEQFFNDSGDDGEVETQLSCIVFEDSNLIVEGIEFRPKDDVK